jgi:hypothetical protein
MANFIVCHRLLASYMDVLYRQTHTCTQKHSYTHIHTHTHTHTFYTMYTRLNITLASTVYRMYYLQK